MPREFKVTDARRGAAFGVRVVTDTEEVAIVGAFPDGSLQVHLTEPFDDGRADAQLIAFLAEELAVDPARVTIVAGAGGPNKLISVEGVSPAVVDAWLSRWR
ncbi:MAG: DUF167 domain-containing protein [Aggregatilineaceae bacterium]